MLSGSSKDAEADLYYEADTWQHSEIKFGWNSLKFCWWHFHVWTDATSCSAVTKLVKLLLLFCFLHLSSINRARRGKIRKWITVGICSELMTVTPESEVNNTFFLLIETICMMWICCYSRQTRTHTFWFKADFNCVCFQWLKKETHYKLCSRDRWWKYFLWLLINTGCTSVCMLHHMCLLFLWRVHCFLTDMLARYKEEELKLQPLGHMCSQQLPLWNEEWLLFTSHRTWIWLPLAGSPIYRQARFVWEIFGKPHSDEHPAQDI